MLKVNDSGTYKDIHELYKKNSSGTYDYLGELYKSDGNGGYSHIFSGGWDTTVTGNPATMTNARAKSMSYEVSGNTKRTVTIDETEYDVPDGYTMLDYLQNNGANCKIRTGVVPSDEECEYYCRFYAAGTSSLYLFASRGGTTQGTKIYGISGSSTGGTIMFVLSGTTLTSNIIRTIGHIYQVKATCTSTGNMTLYVRDETDETEDTVTETLSTWTAAESQIDLFANENSDYLTKDHRVYEAYYKEAGVKKFHLIAAKDSSDVLGMYDFVSDEFFTNKASGTFTAGNTLPTPDNQLGVKGVGDKSANIYNKDETSTSSAATVLAFTEPHRCGINVASGGCVAGVNISAYMNEALECIAIPCVVGETYTPHVFGTVSSYGRCVFIEVDSTGIVLRKSTWASSASVQNSITTTETNCAFLIIEYGGVSDIDAAQFVIVEGSTAPVSYVPYGYEFPLVLNDTTTSTIYDDAPLMKVGTYVDTITSAGTRTNNVGVKVLDGTETWNYNATPSFVWTNGIIPSGISSDNAGGHCTHYTYAGVVGGAGLSSGSYFYNSPGTGLTNGNLSFVDSVNATDVTTWTTYLAAQYAAGTPVTIYYPLATPAAKQIIVPSFTTVAGTNTLECDTSVAPSQLSVTYRKKTQ